MLSVLTARRAGSQYSATPDDDVFKHLAQVYSFSHESMYQGLACPTDSKGFHNGTTNGAQWYLLEGKSSIRHNYLSLNLFLFYYQIIMTESRDLTIHAIHTIN